MCAAAQEPAQITRSGDVVSIENGRIRVAFDLAKGTYEGVDLRDGRVGVTRAGFSVAGWSSTDAERRNTFTDRGLWEGRVSGRALVIQSGAAGQPTLILEIALYRDADFIALTCGLENTTGDEIRVREMYPLAGADIFNGLEKKELKTLDGAGGAGATRVVAGPMRQSANNLLITMVTENGRRSLVLGGLTYREWLKFARVAPTGCTPPARQSALQRAVPQGGRVAAYLDCGVAAPVSSAPNGPRLSVVRGATYEWPGAGEIAGPWYGTVAFDANAVVVEATGLDPTKVYALGFSWWDFDHNGRRESVAIHLKDAVTPDKEARHVILSTQALPAYRDRNELPQERVVLLPAEAYSSGSVELAFTNDANTPNAVVSEVWLTEFPSAAAPPAMLAERTAPSVAQTTAPDAPLTVDLWAADPVGKRVPAGSRYVSTDWFYVSFAINDPFTALEWYGSRFRNSQHAAPNLYNFPTVCGWYVGLFGNPAAHNRPELSTYQVATTPGLVAEMDWIGQTGFSSYSRAAVRIVPDKYAWTEPKELTEQGWWDDEHWARFGHYVAPYETTKKFAEAIRRSGGLPFTYFQLVNESPDFRQAHPEMLLGDDPNRGLDYTDPATQAHMRKVYANLREGGMAGIMFDYPDDYWATQCVRGGFADPNATAAAAYRKVFELAKAGLGPQSWIDERVLGEPQSDITAGVVDSQRVWGDTSAICAEMVARCGLRWYKNRTIFGYDMDAKDLLRGWKQPGFSGTDQDGRRMLLTMSSVAGSRLLLGTSFRDLSAEAVHDLERTFVYYRALGGGARPVDAFVRNGWPRVYDQRFGSREWHQVTLHNNTEPSRELEIRVPLSGEAVDGALGLDAAREYYVYDFWNDRFVGRLKGSEQLSEVLRPGEARMLAIHQVENQPQLVSTNRCILQGYGEGREPRWDAAKREFSGTVNRVIRGETYRLVMATNGWQPVRSSAVRASSRVDALPGSEGLAVLSLDAAADADVDWVVGFESGR